MKKGFLILSLLVVIGLISAQTNGTLTVTATTSKTSTPEYSPKNIVAFWIEDSNGKFVKTILVFAEERQQYLKKWKAVTTLAGSMYNRVGTSTTDATSGATKSSHAARTGKWNGKNVSSVTVADGTYTIKLETTDNDGVAQNFTSFTFEKGRQPVSLTPAAINGYSNISISWVPDITGVKEVETPSLYKIAPNPVKDIIVIPGFGVQSIEIYTLNGSEIMKSADNQLNVSNLPKGIYLLNVVTDQQNYLQKFIKE